MNIQLEFLSRLQSEGYTKKDIRFFVDGKRFRNAMLKDSISEFCKSSSINRGSVYHMFSGKRPIPLDFLEKFGLDVDAPCMITGSNVAINVPKELTKELCYLVGVLRDGTVVRETNGEYLCAFYGKQREFVISISELVKSVFSIEPKIEKLTDVYGIRIRSLTLYLFFKNLFETPQKQASWKTPSIIESASLEMQRSYISGFWDAEGICPRIERLAEVKTKNMYVGFVQKNKESLEFIKRILEESGIKCGKVFWSTDKHVFKISSKSIKKFSEFIESRNAIKSRRLKATAHIFSTDSKQPRVLEFTD